MTPEQSAEVRRLFEDRFLGQRDEVWFQSYLGAVQDVAAADGPTFRSSAFQRRLWELDEVSSVGAGNSVTVTGAYADAEVVDALWRLREWSPPDGVVERARAFDDRFDEILAIVHPRHNARRPSARLARIFAALRPDDVLCLLDWHRTAAFREWLQVPRQDLRLMGQHVVCRDALREALPGERGVERLVSVSQFSWFVWSHVLMPRDPTAPTPVEEAPRATATPRLVLLPAKAQRKGINYLTRNLDLLLAMAQASENGIDRASLDARIAEEAPAMSAGTRAQLLAHGPALGLLTFEGGTYKPTASGLALLDGTPPAEVLTPTMVRVVFGFAQILDDLGRNATMTRAGIAQACRGYYPRWTTDFAPNQLVAWMRDLGLVDVAGVGTLASVTLTDAGEHWRGGLPADVKQEAYLLADERPDEPAAVTGPSAATPVDVLRVPTLASVLERFRGDGDLSTLVFDDEQVALVHAAVHAARGKRFALLAGLSGTGKTSMARGYARAYCLALGLDPAAHYEQVAVLPDWTDPTGLLGFVNPLSTPPTFGETEALRLVLAAAADPAAPYFLCLDEMNLARVEHYFAPFLSAMEGRGGQLTIHAGRDPVDGIPPRVAWPTNLFVFGTVNMDETTHPFSDKVLDRAFTFEFWDVDLEGWRAAATARGESAAAVAAAFPALDALATALRPARRHFGYRTCDEVVGFVAAWEGDGVTAALDAAVLAKVLPKVRGDDGGALPKAIATAMAVCDAHGLTRSAEKLNRMAETLSSVGAVRFWS